MYIPCPCPDMMASMRSHIETYSGWQVCEARPTRRGHSEEARIVRRQACTYARANVLPHSTHRKGFSLVSRYSLLISARIRGGRQGRGGGGELTTAEVTGEVVGTAVCLVADVADEGVDSSTRRRRRRRCRMVVVGGVGGVGVGVGVVVQTSGIGCCRRHGHRITCDCAWPVDGGWLRCSLPPSLPSFQGSPSSLFLVRERTGTETGTGTGTGEVGRTRAGARDDRQAQAACIGPLSHQLHTDCCWRFLLNENSSSFVVVVVTSWRGAEAWSIP
jgi:hypothetical protein